MSDPLVRPVWNALGGRQSALAVTDGDAVRLRPDVGIFAASADGSAASLAALAGLGNGAPFATVETTSPAAPPGYRMASSKPCLQMLLEKLGPAWPPLAFVDLSPANAPAMLALATLTEPGPFMSHTHEFGGFVGVVKADKLVAMAGQRLQPDGHVEISGVCTHPDHRGHGYAAALMRIVAERIFARGETPILHTYAHNTGAISLYERLGFRTLRTLELSMFMPE